MSKIQEALRQIQGQRKKPSENDVGEETQRLATISRRALEIDPNDVDENGEPNGPESIHFAEVDRDALRAAGLIAPEVDAPILEDEYRQIKRPLIANAFGKRAAKVDDGRLIVVASALPGDGKTFTCINLALSMALEKDYSILLVDADVAKPHVSNLFGLEEHKGLLDLIEDPKLSFSDTIVHTDVPRLSLLPSGLSRPQATELLASERMEGILQALVDEDPRRIVVFDSPPLLVTTESQVLAGLMGQIVVVVKAGVTPQNAVEEAVGTLDPTRAINMILNQARRTEDKGKWGRYYGYGSAYGRYGSAENTGKEARSENQ